MHQIDEKIMAGEEAKLAHGVKGENLLLVVTTQLTSMGLPNRFIRDRSSSIFSWTLCVAIMSAVASLILLKMDQASV